MAAKPIIYKMKVVLSDMDKNHYQTLNLTLAQHPSETIERMMVRLLAFCINASDNLSFSKGLSDAQEPDIWARSLDDQIELWIDVGEPAFDRIKKAGHISQSVKVYSFNSKSNAWWKQEQKNFAKLSAEVFQLPWAQVKALALLVERTMDLSISISDNTAYISAEKGDCEVSWQTL
ncbi:YaeQ family protein [Gammaproteobacteria bacterium]|nr:YaeQ family protein [Gammaproteobacteria bacterium]